MSVCNLFFVCMFGFVIVAFGFVLPVFVSFSFLFSLLHHVWVFNARPEVGLRAAAVSDEFKLLDYQRIQAQEILIDELSQQASSQDQDPAPTNCQQAPMLESSSGQTTSKTKEQSCIHQQMRREKYVTDKSSKDKNLQNQMNKKK